MANRFLYLDYNATTPVDPFVGRAMQPYVLEHFGNPSSAHLFGRQARQAVETARAQVAASIGASPQEIVFTSGGTESNNLALRGLVAAVDGGHVVTTAVEHPAVLEVVRYLERKSRISLSVVAVDHDGRVDPAVIEEALQPDTVLVSVMLANNEVGTIQPVKEICEICHRRGVRVHTDAAQAIAKIPVDVEELGVDLLSIAGHKLYAPKGVGALYIRKGTPVEPLIYGAAHEQGLRAGTENVLEVVGLGAAAIMINDGLDAEADRFRQLCSRLLSCFKKASPDLIVHGRLGHTLPNTVCVAFPGIDASQLLERLSDSVAASAGAACHSDVLRISHVLDAMGVEPEVARGTVRFSLGRFSEKWEVDEAAERVLREIKSMTSNLVSPGRGVS